MPAPDVVLGILTVVMAVLGGAVSLHAPQKWQAKAAYALAFVVIGALSIFYVEKQSKETTNANLSLSNALVNLSNSTTYIATMTQLNTELQNKIIKQSDAIVE